MNKVLRFSLKAARQVNLALYPDGSIFGRNSKMFPLKDYASSLIFEALSSQEPTMIARLGATEMSCLTNYLGVKKITDRGINKFIKGQVPEWWWEKSKIREMEKSSGFFPQSIPKIEQFCELMLSDMSNINILGSWLKEERFFKKQLFHARQVMLEDLEPFFVSNIPWTQALKHKKVLVVHPFEETIRRQFLVKDKLFSNNLLPDFELITIKAVQTIAGEKSPFSDWFEALDYMKEQIDSKDYDICILGCGAYGLPLASFIKKRGKKAIHLGGVTQLLFGIKGKRWENYLWYPYENLYNDYWVRPGDSEKPVNASVVEGGCYW